MKIVIISSLFFESTFPLVKRLAEYNEVTLFCLVSKTSLRVPMMDLSGSDNLPIGLLDDNEKKSVLPDNVRYYFENTMVRVELLVLSGGKNLFWDSFAILRFVSRLNNQKADKYHFVGQSVYYSLIYPFLRHKDTIHTFHESYQRVTNTNNYIKKILLKKLYLLVSKKCSPLIFHSDNVRLQFINDFHLSNRKNTFVVPFGLFEGFKNFTTKINTEFSYKNSILFFGHIVPYKGVDVFLEAINCLNSKNVKAKYVIAGKDSIGIEKSNLPSNVIFINKFLEESEVVKLIKNCFCVVLPYKSASQSGIPNTAFVFNKPVIVSDIKGLNDIIINEVNGLIVEPNSPIDLSSKILSLINDNEMYVKMTKNIENLKNIEHLEWKAIAKRTFDIYNSSYEK